MKKIILMATAVLFAAATVSAQDLESATNVYNDGAMALNQEDYATALNSFKQALSQAEACGEEGAELVGKCKEIIPQLELSIGKELIKNESFDEAISQLKQAIATAKEYGNAEVETDATQLIPQVLQSKAGNLLNAKDYAGAAAVYKEVIALDPDNGTAQLRLGMALGATGNVEEAEAAYLAAAQAGQEAAAKKQLSTLFLKRASANLKGKKYDAAIGDALKSNEYLENATAMKIAGTAANAAKKGAEAIEYLEKYLTLSPSAKDANKMYYTIAALAQGLGDKAKAKEYYQKIVGDPQFGEYAKAQLQVL